MIETWKPDLLWIDGPNNEVLDIYYLVGLVGGAIERWNTFFYNAPGGSQSSRIPPKWCWIFTNFHCLSLSYIIITYSKQTGAKHIRCGITFPKTVLLKRDLYVLTYMHTNTWILLLLIEHLCTCVTWKLSSSCFVIYGTFIKSSQLYSGSTSLDNCLLFPQPTY